MNKTEKTNIWDNKILWMIVSLLLSFLAWAYISSTEDTSVERIFTGVPVVFQGAEELRSSRGLIITDASADSVTVKVSGSRASIGNLHAADLTAVVDVSGISQVRDMTVSYTVRFPDNVNMSGVEVHSKTPETIEFSVVQENSKTVEVKGVFTGSVAEGFTVDPIVVEPASVTLYGPASELDQIDSACVYIDRQNVSATIGPLNSEFVLLDADGSTIRPASVTSSQTSVTVTVPVLMNKELALKVNLVEGSGATADNTVVEIEPKTIQVAGSTATLENLNQIVIGTVDLTDFAETTTITFPITLDNNIRNLTGTTEATVTVTVTGMETKKFTVTNITLTGGAGTLQTTQKEIVVRGTAEDLANITEENIRIVADLTEYAGATGTIEVPARVYVDGYEKAGAVGDYTVSVTLG